MISVATEPMCRRLVDEMATDRGRDNQIAIWWLGQAGFAVRWRGRLGFIDPYLSDYLARKYRGKEFEHIRMIPPPVDPSAVRGLDYVLCTHRHSDHMDPESLPVLARGNPSCRFVVPRADAERALEIGLSEGRLSLVDAGEAVSIGPGIEIEAIASAHEEIRTNDRGEHHFLGYIVRLGPFTIYHAGDCAPYAGLEESIAGRGIDVALLPVNGRDGVRKAKGVPGNFTPQEAVDLCRGCRIPVLIAHHFEMFEFNTVDVGKLIDLSRDPALGVRLIVPQIGAAYLINN